MSHCYEADCTTFTQIPQFFNRNFKLRVNLHSNSGVPWANSVFQPLLSCSPITTLHMIHIKYHYHNPFGSLIWSLKCRKDFRVNNDNLKALGKNGKHVEAITSDTLLLKGGILAYQSRKSTGGSNMTAFHSDELFPVRWFSVLAHSFLLGYQWHGCWSLHLCFTCFTGHLESLILILSEWSLSLYLSFLLCSQTPVSRATDRGMMVNWAGLERLYVNPSCGKSWPYCIFCLVNLSYGFLLSTWVTSFSSQLELCLSLAIC